MCIRDRVKSAPSIFAPSKLLSINNAFVKLSKLNNETGGVRKISDQKIKKDLQMG